MSEMSRRRMLGMSLGAVTVAGLGAPATAADAASPQSGPPLPPVPGMRGDRRANEVWYQLDEVGLFNPGQEFIEAILAIKAAFPGDGFEVAIARAWVNDRLAGTYPGGFRSQVAPVRDAMQVVSDVQKAVYDTLYRYNWAGLTGAMIDFGQGVLYDPRRKDGSKVHMMNGNPPPGYHTWHAFNRAFQLLDISASYWARFDRLVGLGWALQSTAKPVRDAFNPPLPSEVVRRLTKQWLRMSPQQADEAFMSFPYPPGIS